MSLRTSCSPYLSPPLGLVPFRSVIITVVTLVKKDVLAASLGKGEEVSAWTKKAMEGNTKFDEATTTEGGVYPCRYGRCPAAAYDLIPPPDIERTTMMIKLVRILWPLLRV